MFKPRWLGMVVALPILFALNGLGAGNLKRQGAVGSIAGVKGTVQVDHRPVLDKEAVFSGEVVSTGASSGAILNLRGTVAILVENSELALTGSGGAPTMALKRGALEIRSGGSQPAQIYIGKASVVVRTDGDFTSICRIASVDKSSVVIADKGHVEIHGAGAPMIVHPGKTVRLEAGVPQAAAGQSAGKVSGEIPAATVQRVGAGKANPLTLSDAIYWEDLVETIVNGRVRIALEGGSFLNIGARSKMIIHQHNAQSQQTEVELKLGTLRGEVVKLTKGGKFETTTPTAVIGVVGTVYVVNAAPQDTYVLSVSGDVTVRNVDPNVPGTVVLHTGQSTHVGLGQPPSEPSVATAGQLQVQLQQTDVPEGGITAATAGTQAGTAGGGAATSAPGVPTGITNVAALGASGVAAVAGGVAIHEMTQAHANVAAAESSLANAANAASQAATSATSAQNAANQALSASQQASNIATTVANQVNSILQGCGCVSPSSP